MNLIDGRHFYSNRVAYKLRFAFCSILALLLMAIAIGGHQLWNLKTSRQQAIQHSVRALVHYQKMASQLTQLSEYAIRLQAESSLQQSRHYAAKIEMISEQIMESVEATASRIGNDHPTPYTDRNISNLKKELELLTTNRTELVKYKLLTLGQRWLIDYDLVAVDTIYHEVISALKPHLATAVSRYTKNLKHLYETTESGHSSEDELLLLEEYGKTEFLLSEITRQVSKVFEEIKKFPLHTDKDNATDARKRIEIETRRITHLLAELKNQEMRSQIASLVKKLRRKSLGTNGIVANSRQRAENNLQFQRALLNQNTIMEKVTDSINSSVTSTQKIALKSAKSFDRELQMTFLYIVALALTITVLTVLVIHYVVELQFNQRITKLTSAVNDIAAGEVTRQVNISGNDEIGEMAKALEVFKLNAKELQRSNRELEQFAYAASHDLKSPLASIKLLADWIKEDATNLSVECQENLNLLLSRVGRLSALQTDLLEYAKAGQADDDICLLDLQKMIEALSDLVDPERKFKITVSQPDPLLARTHTVPLQQVLLNLLTNAIKHHDHSEGVIDIAVHVSESRLRFTVSDDGPGIDPIYHEKIFGLFKTLQSKDEVEGSGLGLSLVRKLIERYHGSIEVTSVKGKRGTIFSFDWPLV